jgi:predicted O-methyltransferase YrrM
VQTELQDELFESVDLDRQMGIQRLDAILKKEFSKTYNEKDGMFSEHLILFAAISVSKHKIKRILEIGTYDGRTALILSSLFPAAEIITIDLPEADPIFSDTYGRVGSVSEFVRERNERLKNRMNIKQKSINSVQLTLFDERFDLIWIDGAHGYPVVAMDIVNSFRLSNFGAYVLIDDVWTKSIQSDSMYKSSGAFESLEALKCAGLIERYHLFNKRLGSIFNSPSEKKFVALYIKRL